MDLAVALKIVTAIRLVGSNCEGSRKFISRLTM
jgi:hypothetical protein